MKDVPVKIVGISNTKIKDGNCDRVMEEALRTAAGFEGVTTKFITLADKEIRPCEHSQWCIEHQSPCHHRDDDALWILDEMSVADGLIWGSPVWSHTIPPFLPAIMSRARYQCFFSGDLRDKVLGTYVVSWFGVGEEFALMTLEALAHNYLMIPVFRGWAKTSTAAFGQRPDYMENGALDDTGGMIRIKTMAKRVVEVTRKIKFAELSGVDFPEHRSITCGQFPLWDQRLKATQENS